RKSLPITGGRGRTKPRYCGLVQHQGTSLRRTGLLARPKQTDGPGDPSYEAQTPSLILHWTIPVSAVADRGPMRFTGTVVRRVLAVAGGVRARSWPPARERRRPHRVPCR